jgi:hypothetical protein
MNRAKVTATAKGIGFTGVLTIAFVVLKLCGVIKWSWLWVLSPIWISIVLWVLLFVIIYRLFK